MEYLIALFSIGASIAIAQYFNASKMITFVITVVAIFWMALGYIIIF